MEGDITVLETRNYELMFIVSPELDDEAVDNVMQRAKRYFELAETQVRSFKSWGMRRLAYPIQDKREGRYFVVQFSAESSVINELDRNLRLVEGILRHLITRIEDVELLEEVQESSTEDATPEAAAPEAPEDVVEGATAS